MVLDFGFSVPQAIVSGIILGSLFAIMAMGLTLTYGTTRVLNFSHGAFFMFGAFLLWYLTAVQRGVRTGAEVGSANLGLPYPGAFLIGMIVVFVMGIALDAGVIKPLRGKLNWEVTTLISTLGIALFLQSVALMAFGARTKIVDSPFPGTFALGEITLTHSETLIIGVSIFSLVFMQIFLRKHKLGLAMRAVPQNIEAAYFMGIKVHRVYRFTFGMSAALAAVGGMLLANVLLISPEMGWIPLLTAFMVIVFGGVGSINGTIIAAYVMGLIQSFASSLIALSWSLPVMFAFMVVIMLLRPQGLFGLKE